MNHCLHLALTLIITPTLATVAAAVDFSRDVYPILRRACFECHGPAKQEGGLRLDNRAAALESGSISVGDPAASELMRRLQLPAADEQRMPAIGKSLSSDELTAIRHWIEAGADWPDHVEMPPHWAYVPPQRPMIPGNDGDVWGENAIDAFVLKGLTRHGLQPSPKAAPEQLIRRLYFDLIGLPPSVDEVNSFVTNFSDNRYESLVDDLLSRSQFGERWARPWLDLARYADSHGFQRDDLREVWAYRDWVIRAINDDMPFDQFTIEQLAGDLLPNATQSQRIATGFHRCSPTNVEAGSIPEETRIAQVIDRVNTTATVWLGSTLECAQCHDHKFDPFTAADYYQIFAFFNHTELEADRADPKLPSSIQFLGPAMPLADDARDPQRVKLQISIDALQALLSTRRRELAADLESWATSASASLGDLAQVHPLVIEGFESAGNTDSVQYLDDGSVLLSGDDAPPKDTYVFRTRLGSSNIRAIRIDAMTDPSLPGSGPGRGDDERPNFVLNEFTATRVAGGKPGKRLAFRTALADFAQKGFPVVNAIDGDIATGWAINPEFGQPHWATFVLDEPIGNQTETELEIRLVQNFGGARTIGRLRVSAVTGNVEAESIPVAVTQAIAKPPTKWTQRDRQALIDYREQVDTVALSIGKQITAAEKKLGQLKSDTTLVMIERGEPRMSNIFVRGDYKNPGANVTAATPSFLHPYQRTFGDEPTPTLNRLDLARWLVDPANPLMARVTVNRWWAELFGRGIVETVEDFGIKGEPPSHPELLDWLAIRFVEQGWSMKQIIREIVTSATYRQQSSVTSEQIAIDDLNQWLGRGPSFRLDAEMVRDNALAISGLINLQSLGPSIRPYQPDGIWTKVGGAKYDYQTSPGGEAYRRGIYVVLKRGAPYPSFTNFDASNRLTCTVKRSRTNTPLQALTLLNDPVYVEATKSLALYAASVTEESPSKIIAELFCNCTSRFPTDRELTVLLQLYDSQFDAAAVNQAQVQTLAKDIRLPGKVTIEAFSAWYSVASVLMNLHETITKP